MTFDELRGLLTSLRETQDQLLSWVRAAVRAGALQILGPEREQDIDEICASFTEKLLAENFRDLEKIKESPDAYLVTTGRHRAIDLLDRRSRMHDLPEEQIPEQVQEEPPDAFANAQAHAEVIRAIKSAEAAACYLLQVRDGFAISQREISQNAGKSETERRRISAQIKKAVEEVRNRHKTPESPERDDEDA